MKYGLILAGGSGNRLWPSSRPEHPKQFLNLGNSQFTLYQDTFLRLSSVLANEHIWTISNEKHISAISYQLKQLKVKNEREQLLTEPIGRNTAPAILWSSLVLNEVDPNAIMSVMPSDHVINDKEAFLDALNKAYTAAEEGYLVTFGLKPETPETGFGYIQMGEEYIHGTHKVSRFVEKPDLETAEKYLEEGNYVWNSGMFVFHVKTILDYFEKLCPELWQVFQEAKVSSNTWNDLSVAKRAFSNAQSISIDYAIMEKAEKVLVLPCEIGWSDLGSWEAIYENKKKDANGNSLKGDVLTYETKNSLIVSNSKLITTVGVENLIVIETADAIMICDKSKSQDVKKIVEQLQTRKRQEAEVHKNKIYSWGTGNVLYDTPQVKINLIEIKPGEKTDDSFHYHRGKHIMIMDGVAEITVEDESFVCKGLESIDIESCCHHMIKNPGKIPLKLVEIEHGNYLGADDHSR